MAETSKPVLTVRVHRSFRRNGYFGRRGYLITVNEATAKWVLERGLGELVKNEERERN